MGPEPLRQAFSSHPRQWRSFRYVYPVIARRSRGLSIGVNLNPDGACTFDCVYCCVDRTTPRPSAEVDLQRLGAELNDLLCGWEQLFEQPEFAAVPTEFRRLNDIAFSGDGEPTAAREFPDALDLALAARTAAHVEQAKIVVITNGTCLAAPAVVGALAKLDGRNGEIWAKLDAGTEAYYRRVNRTGVPLARVMDNLLLTARVRPIVIQSLFARLDGQSPSIEEVEAYVKRLLWLREQGGGIRQVQVYTVARRTAEAGVTSLSEDELEFIAARVRAHRFEVAVYP